MKRIVFPMISCRNWTVGLCCKLGELVRKCEEPTKILSFVTIFHALNNFCSVDMSAVYLDIFKDRLYTFRADSPLRRGSQTVLFEIVVALTKLMAPILSFTAEEIWRTLRADGAKVDTIACIWLCSPRQP